MEMVSVSSHSPESKLSKNNLGELQWGKGVIPKDYKYVVVLGEISSK